MLIFPLTEAREVLRTYIDLSASAPDGLVIHAILTLPPRDPGPIVMLQICYSGDDLTEGERLLALLRQCGYPIADTLQPIPYGKLFEMFDPPAPAGLHYYDTAYTLRTPTDAALDVIIAAACQFTTPFGSVVIHQVRGAASRVGPNATAFALREPHFGVVHMSFWVEGAGDAERAWADCTLAAMAPFALACT